MFQVLCYVPVYSDEQGQCLSFLEVYSLIVGKEGMWGMQAIEWGKLSKSYKRELKPEDLNVLEVPISSYIH